jgi:hypothetical protein
MGSAATKNASFGRRSFIVASYIDVVGRWEGEWRYRMETKTTIRRLLSAAFSAARLSGGAEDGFEVFGATRPVFGSAKLGLPGMLLSWHIF